MNTIYYTTKHGGLFLKDSGKQMMMAEVENYQSEIEVARVSQIAKQGKMTTAEIFQALANRLKDVTVKHKNGDAIGTGKVMADAILAAIDREGLYFSVNQRGFLILNRLDGDTPLQADYLGGMFQKLINAIDPRFTEFPEIAVVFNGEDFYTNYFLPKLRMY